MIQSYNNTTVEYLLRGVIIILSLRVSFLFHSHRDDRLALVHSQYNDVEEVISIIQNLESSKLERGRMTSKYRKCAGPGHISLDSHGSLGYDSVARFRICRQFWAWCNSC